MHTIGLTSHAIRRTDLVKHSLIMPLKDLNMPYDRLIIPLEDLIRSEEGLIKQFEDFTIPRKQH